MMPEPKRTLSETIDDFRELMKDPRVEASLTREHKLVALEVVNAAISALLEDLKK